VLHPERDGEREVLFGPEDAGVAQVRGQQDGE
jgi:hypothetical protein